MNFSAPYGMIDKVVGELVKFAPLRLEFLSREYNKYIMRAIHQTTIFLFTSILLLSACANSVQAAQLEATPEPTITSTSEPTATATEVPSPTPTPDTRLLPEAWKEWPIIPEFSNRAMQIYQQGLTMGNNPQHFSKVGDCQNTTGYFLGIFDNPRGGKEYRLGDEYEYLQETIDYFAGSFYRQSESVKGGSNVAYVLNPMYADPEACESNETPLACEIRIYKPSFAIVRMEKWGRKPVDMYEKYMREIIEYLIEHGVVPILVTKADNSEGDHSVNYTVAKLAYEYDIPMWNFWAAAWPLPDHGLRLDGFHLKVGYIQFDNPQAMKLGWPVCNLTALQTLDAARKFVEK